MVDLNTLITLAQTSGTDALTGAAPAAAPAAGGAVPGAPVGATPASPLSSLPFFFMIFAFFGIMILFQVLGARKERKKRAELMGSLRRGDKVLTIGGIIGVVDQVRDDEVVVKIDPNTNAKMTFTKSSIQQIIAKSDAKGDAEVEVKAKGDKVGAA